MFIGGGSEHDSLEVGNAYDWYPGSGIGRDLGADARPALRKPGRHRSVRCRPAPCRQAIFVASSSSGTGGSTIRGQSWGPGTCPAVAISAP